MLAAIYFVLCIYIIKTEFNSINLMHLFVCFDCSTIKTHKEMHACTMGMHAGSPLQKNAPIFGNVFTVTFLVQYLLRNAICM